MGYLVSGHCLLQEAPDFYMQLAPSEVLLQITYDMGPSVSAKGHFFLGGQRNLVRPFPKCHKIIIRIFHILGEVPPVPRTML